MKIKNKSNTDLAERRSFLFEAAAFGASIFSLFGFLFCQTDKKNYLKGNPENPEKNVVKTNIHPLAVSRLRGGLK